MENGVSPEKWQLDAERTLLWYKAIEAIIVSYANLKSVPAKERETALYELPVWVKPIRDSEGKVNSVQFDLEQAGVTDLSLNGLSHFLFTERLRIWLNTHGRNASQILDEISSIQGKLALPGIAELPDQGEIEGKPYNLRRHDFKIYPGKTKTGEQTYVIQGTVSFEYIPPYGYQNLVGDVLKTEYTEPKEYGPEESVAVVDGEGKVRLVQAQNLYNFKTREKVSGYTWKGISAGFDITMFISGGTGLLLRAAGSASKKAIGRNLFSLAAGATGVLNNAWGHTNAEWLLDARDKVFIGLAAKHLLHDIPKGLLGTKAMSESATNLQRILRKTTGVFETAFVIAFFSGSPARIAKDARLDSGIGIGLDRPLIQGDFQRIYREHQLSIINRCLDSRDKFAPFPAKERRTLKERLKRLEEILTDPNANLEKARKELARQFLRQDPESSSNQRWLAAISLLATYSPGEYPEYVATFRPQTVAKNRTELTYVSFEDVSNYILKQFGAEMEFGVSESGIDHGILLGHLQLIPAQTHLDLLVKRIEGADASSKESKMLAIREFGSHLLLQSLSGNMLPPAARVNFEHDLKRLEAVIGNHQLEESLRATALSIWKEVHRPNGKKAPENDFSAQMEAVLKDVPLDQACRLFMIITSPPRTDWNKSLQADFALDFLHALYTSPDLSTTTVDVEKVLIRCLWMISGKDAQWRIAVNRVNKIAKACRSGLTVSP